MKKTFLISVGCLLLIFIAYSQLAPKLEKKLTLEALDEITLKTGKSSITMKKDGSIFINGSDITIVGIDKVNVKASGNIILKGSKIKEN